MFEHTVSGQSFGGNANGIGVESVAVASANYGVWGYTPLRYPQALGPQRTTSGKRLPIY